MLKYLLAALAAAASIGSAQATIITFDTDKSIVPFTGTYNQNGYSVSYSAGALKIIDNSFNFGDVLATNYSVAGGGEFILSRDNGGLFSIQSFSGGSAANNVKTSFYVAGYLAGKITYNQSFTAATVSNVLAKMTTLPTVNVFDSIRFRTPSSNAAFDNINVTEIATPAPDPVSPMSAVPESATWAMMIVGFGVVGYAMRRRTGLRAVQAI